LRHLPDLSHLAILEHLPPLASPLLFTGPKSDRVKEKSQRVETVSVRCPDVKKSKIINNHVKTTYEEMGWNSRICDWVRAGRPRGQSSSPGRVKDIFYSTETRPALGTTQGPYIGYSWLFLRR
jgi:hypothetical protein